MPRDPGASGVFDVAVLDEPASRVLDGLARRAGGEYPSSFRALESSKVIWVVDIRAASRGTEGCAAQEPALDELRDVGHAERQRPRDAGAWPRGGRCKRRAPASSCCSE